MCKPCLSSRAAIGERIHRKFQSRIRDELLKGGVFSTVPEVNVLTDAWRRLYDHRRPHSALRYRPPAP
ncbi:MAG: hypothetical protein CME05_15380 [Gemmatimonadaceae bacterium]|nr:hypothetical protein [Gemmatimonadaceae bacterium]